jgi:MarR family
MKRDQRFHYEKVKMFNEFISDGIRTMNRSEGFTWLILYGDMKPDGFSRTSRSEVVRRGGMSKAQATRALQSLIARGLVTRVCEGYPGKATLYTLFVLPNLVKFSPAAKALIAKTNDKTCRMNGVRKESNITPLSAAPV